MFKKIIMLSTLSLSLFAVDQLITNSVNQDGVKEVTNTTIVKGDAIALSKSENKEILNSLEFKSLLQQAYAKGYQDGAEHAMTDMNIKLSRLEKYMDGLFNFHKLILEGKYEPPKIGIAITPVEVSDDGQQMSIESRRFIVLEQGHFIDEARTWKTFLLEGNK